MVELSSTWQSVSTKHHQQTLQDTDGHNVRLHVHVRTRHLVDKTRLADVWEPRDEQRACVGVYRRETREMLTYLLKIGKG